MISQIVVEEDVVSSGSGVSIEDESLTAVTSGPRATEVDDVEAAIGIVVASVWIVRTVLNVVDDVL